MQKTVTLLIVLALAALPVVAAAQSTTLQQLGQPGPNGQLVPPQNLPAPQPPLQLSQQGQVVPQQQLSPEQWQQYQQYLARPVYQQSWPSLRQQTGWQGTTSWPANTGWPTTGWSQEPQQLGQQPQQP